MNIEVKKWIANTPSTQIVGVSDSLLADVRKACVMGKNPKESVVICITPSLKKVTHEILAEITKSVHEAQYE